MEALSRMASATVDRRLLSGFLVWSRNKNELLLSHLLLVNDTLSFCEANIDHLSHLHFLFLCFEVVSRFKINLAKSKSVLVSVVKDVEALSASLVVGFPLCL